MKDEKIVRPRRAAGAKWRPVALLMAAVLMILSLPIGGKPVYAVDLDANCALTISPGNVTMAEDLKNANVVIDLYRIADAVPVSGYDTYDWQMNAPFDGITIAKDIDTAGWKKAAQEAADIVLGKAPAGATEWDPSESVSKIPAELVVSGKPAGEKIEPLKAGLYLIIARGSDVTEYASSDTSAAPAAGTAPDAAESSGTVTIANSQTYTYKYSPELISLPTKAVGQGEDGTVIPPRTSDPGDWIYEAEAQLKPTQNVRNGRLKIVKELMIYEEREKTTDGETRDIQDPATFIFEVSIYKNKELYDPAAPDQNRIYHDFVSIVFDTYGKKSVLIDNLPVGSYAVVTEEYSGAVYTLETEPRDATIPANDTVTVSFENTYNGKNNGGGSVTNKFTYSTDKGKWGWQQVSDDTDEAEVIQSE